MIKIHHQDITRLHFIVFVLLLLLTGQCRPKTNRLDNRNYFNRYYTLIDTSANENKLKAVAILDSALKAFPNYGIFDLYSIDSIKEDAYSYAKHDYTTAMRYADTMLMLVEKDTNREEFAERYARSLYYKGHLFSQLKNFDQAFYYNRLAKEFEINNVQNKCSLTDCSNFLAYMLVAQDKYLNAARAFVKSYQADELCPAGSYKRLMETQKKLVDAGLTYGKSGFTDSASYFYARALDLINATETKFPEHYTSTNNAKAVIYADQGQILVESKRFKEAVSLFSKSISTTQSVDVIVTQYTEARLIYCYLQLNLLKEANELLGNLRLSLNTVGNESVWLDWHMLKSDYFKRRNEFKKAYGFMREYYLIRDSVNQRRKEFSAVDINNRMEEIEHKYLLAVLEKRNEATLHYLYFAVSIVIAAVSLLLLIWQNLRHIKKLSIKMKFKNAELQKAYEMLEISHLENTHIMHVLAHDLKNPLIATNNLVHILLKKNTNRTEVEILTTIRSSCTQSIDLINDLTVKRQDPKINKFQNVDVFEIAKNSIKLLQTLADRKNQQLILMGQTVFAMINQQEIWRVVSNLISNAIKYSPSGSIINVRLAMSDDKISFSVTDRGIGIPDNLKDSIFTTAAEKGRPGTIGESSSGIGLLICKKIIEQHKGEIRFESDQLKGTTFTFLIPIVQSQTTID